MHMTVIEAEKNMIERLMEDFYQLGLSDRMIASLCLESTAQVTCWRLSKGYPPNDFEVPYNPRTGAPFSAPDMRRAINNILDKYHQEV